MILTLYSPSNRQVRPLKMSESLLIASTAIGVAANTLTAVTTGEALIKLLVFGSRVGFLQKNLPGENLLIGQRNVGEANQYIHDSKDIIDEDDRKEFYHSLNLLRQEEERLKQALRKLPSLRFFSKDRAKIYRDSVHFANEAIILKQQAYNTSKDARAAADMREVGVEPYICLRATNLPSNTSATSPSNPLGSGQTLMVMDQPEENADIGVDLDYDSGQSLYGSWLSLNDHEPEEDFIIDAVTLCATLAEQAGLFFEAGDAQSLSSFSSAINSSRRWEFVRLQRLLDNDHAGETK
ncbi:hypothetical protein BXZ70DRAFT_8736 [Cristinia sonorae]|uniref:Uncharacterized protein n=1 Tax=Cristinia sonorae TaxID=1940300 RepID=A0A8K0UY93_9AGAR|nr:hypothetical protein BXZ70DRAFT_8736 [Cristinia sonorae]